MHFKRLVQKWVHDLGAVIAKTARIVVIFATGAIVINTILLFVAQRK